MKIYIDTSAFLAIMDADDDRHQSARNIWIRLLESNSELMCSSYVLVETYALLQRRIGMEAFRTFHEDIVPLLRVEWVQDVIHQQSANAILTANRKNLSLVDCASFSIMRHYGLKHVFTFDRHFVEQGFICLA